MASLILVRHGESQWNLEQRFTGWADVGLTARGIEQMRVAGTALLSEGIELDVTFSSALSRCIHSLWILLESMDMVWVTQHVDWRLNERHYGALTGQMKMRAEERYGTLAVKEWRRGYAAQPPPLDEAAREYVNLDQRYAGVPARDLPKTESLSQTVGRVSKAWVEAIAPQLLYGRSVVVVAHGNSLRALTKIVEELSDAEVGQVEIGNGEPCIYDINAALKATNKRILMQDIKSPSHIL
ncbi:2,3-bisphosphoglycerate-dependent phosphoglycerate mutase [Robbsia sp. Bb-Pol-6]|uniref:2,3-bisphosphoglycerate-dependent phosphoglycerate mutase n=1 Tax=Robbsia betulipollinis TaxID=2981849 RepID=A0ABT3ZPD9_9BURK|nr:2,3-bisphosphoglycerate-dependent phosphoglycerate mutase [Robbsia betulipollinis]